MYLSRIRGNKLLYTAVYYQLGDEDEKISYERF